MVKVEIGPVATVGELREKLRTLDDDDMIYYQVVAEDGTAWYLGADAGTTKKGSMFVISLRHPELKTLPKI